MALIYQEAQRLTLDNLKAKIISTNLKRGPALLTSRLPCKWDPSDTVKLLFETNAEITSSLVDPFPNSGPITGTQATWLNGVHGTNNDSRPSQELFVGWKLMQRFADVHDAHQYDDKYFDRTQVEINKQYQYVLQQWNDHMINGVAHNDLQFNGWEYWLTHSAQFRPEVKIYGTDDATATGAPQPFSLAMIRNLITTIKCGQFDALVTDIDTFNALMTLLEAAGGNTAPMLMADNFGVPVMSNGQYAGVPVVVSDDVEPQFSHGPSASTAGFQILGGSLDTVTVPATDMTFRGFNDGMVGRVFRATGVTFGGGNVTTTVASFIDANNITLADPADAAVVLSGSTFTMESGNAMYAVRFSEDDGFHFRHPVANGASADGVYPCLPAVCGLQELMLGNLQNLPQVVRTAIQLRGNFMVESAYSIARLSGFEILI